MVNRIKDDPVPSQDEFLLRRFFDRTGAVGSLDARGSVRAFDELRGAGKLNHSDERWWVLAGE